MLEVLVGNIAVGKTTYCKKRAEEGAIIVSDDSMVDSLHIKNSLYKKELKPLYKRLQNEVIKYCLENNIDVIIDRRNHKRKTRMRYSSECRKYNIKCKYIVFPRYTPEILGTRRFTSDSRGQSKDYWIEVAQRTEDQFDCVHPFEGYDILEYFPEFD